MSVLRPLILLSIILTASGFASEQLGPIVGPVEYNGYLVFDYPEGDNPIVNIVFDVDPWVSECLIILNVPAPWIYTYSDPILTLSGGSLNPGGSVSVTVSLDDYFLEGEYQVTSVGTTSAGEVSNAVGPLLVGDLYLLRVISLANTYQTPLLGSVIGLIALELMFWYRNRPFRDIIPPVKEVNDFVRESEKILNQNGTPKDPIVSDSNPDLIHESVIPELAPYDGSAPVNKEKEAPDIDNTTQHSMYQPGEDPSELFRDLNEHSEKSPEESKKGETFLGGSLTGYEDWKYEFTPEQVDNILNSGKAKTPEEIAEAIGDSLLPDSGTINSDPSTTEIKTPKNQTKIDTSEYDDSDLPGLEDLPEPDSSEYDDNDLPGLDDQTSTTKPTTSDKGEEKTTDTKGKKLPR